jgi:hypothetical protein
MQRTKIDFSENGQDHMKHSVFSFIALAAAGMAGLLCMCSTTLLAGGNSSQTGNSGLVVSSLSQTVSGTTRPAAHVSVYSQSYLPYVNTPGLCDSVIADDSGHFTFAGLPQGYFSILANDTVSGTTGFMSPVPVFPDVSFADTIDTLRQPGFIAGTLTDTAGKALALSYVFINGSPFYSVTKNTGEFLLGPMPSGTYTLQFYANFTADANGMLVQVSKFVPQNGTATVFPDSISSWHW